MFKVVPDQLRISEGWVRCGKCEEIFDASAHMQETLPHDEGAAPEPAPFDGVLATAMAADAGAHPVAPARPDPADGLDIDLKDLNPGPDPAPQPPPISPSMAATTRT